MHGWVGVSCQLVIFLLLAQRVGDKQLDNILRDKSIGYPVAAVT